MQPRSLPLVEKLAALPARSNYGEIQQDLVAGIGWNQYDSEKNNGHAPIWGQKHTLGHELGLVEQRWLA